MKIVTLIALAALNASCPSPVPPGPPLPVDAATPVPVRDAGPTPFDASDTNETACAGLRASGCPEGFWAECPEVMATATRRRLLNLNPVCLALCTNEFCVHNCTSDIECQP